MPSEAVATALAIAAENGLRCEEPVVLRDAWHVLVHLRPLPLVARVSTTVPFPEGPHADDVVRELAVASHAARGGAPVIPPSDELDPGPHCRDGRFVTFWRYVERAGEVDALRAGEGLRAVHEALADYAGPLPAAGHRPDVTAMLATLEPSAYVELLGEIAANTPTFDGQALHGDAHVWNCLPTAGGPLWHDFECACRGPREYDLAALMLADLHGGNELARETLAAYGEHDPDLLTTLVPVYAAWVYTSMLVALPRRPEIAGLPWEERFAWLRATARGSA